MFTPVPTNWANSSCEIHWNTCMREVEGKGGGEGREVGHRGKGRVRAKNITSSSSNRLASCPGCVYSNMAARL